MKRSLILAVSVLALTAVSKTLFAAETETPAPTERAAPAAERAPAPTERAAPAAERAPAQQRRARPVQRTTQTSQTSQQSVQQTWTGAQGGGFGGGNAGGAGFADDVCFNHMGVFLPQLSQSSQSLQSQSTCPPHQSLTTSAPPKFNSGSGGGFIGYGFAIPFPVGSDPFALRGIYLGAEAMVSYNNVNNTYTLNQGYPGALFGCCQEFTNDSRTATTHIGTSYSGLVRFGVLVTDKMLVYFTGGSATAKVSATFTHTGFTTINNTFAASLVTGSSTVDKTVTGYALGGGWEFAYLPGVKIRVQYLHAQFPDINFVTLLTPTVCVGNPSCNGGAETNKVNPSFNQVTVGVGFSL